VYFSPAKSRLRTEALAEKQDCDNSWPVIPVMHLRAMTCQYGNQR